MKRRNGFVGIALLGTIIVLAAADSVEAQIIRGRRSRGTEAAPPPTQQSPATTQQPAQQPAATTPAQSQMQIQYRGLRGRRAYYVTPTVPQQPGTTANQSRPSFYPADQARSAQIRMRLPSADAEVRFDGQNTQQKGMMRLFTTPPLDGISSYQVTAVFQQNGQQVTRERTVSVRPGALVTVDFTATR